MDTNRPRTYGSADPLPDPATPPDAPVVPSSPTAPSSNMPASTQAQPAQSAQAQMADLTAAVAATTTIEDSCVTLLQGVAAQYVFAAPGNAAVAQLSANLRASATKLGQAITDCTSAAAPPVSPAQAQMGGTKSKR